MKNAGRNITGILDALDGYFGVEKRPGRDPLQVLIRGVLSQNTSDTNSGRAFDSLMKHYEGSWDAIRRAPLPAIAEAIRSGGLAGQKALTIKNALEWLHASTGAYSLDFLDGLTIREAEKRLTHIKGVGIKTARLVLLFGLGKPAFVVDTHVLRVCMRLGLLPDGCSRIKAHGIMSVLIPQGRTYSAHINMIKLGRRLCRPRNPLCGQCPAAHFCLHSRNS